MTRRARLLATALAVLVHPLLLLAPLVAAGGWRQAAQPCILLFLVVASAWCLLEATTQPRRRKAEKLAGRLPLLIGLSLLTVFWLSLLERGLGSGSSGVVVCAAGVLLMGTGIALRLAAIRTLGSYFLDEITLLPGQPLVTGGVYGRIRHPSEVGTLTVAFGATLLLSSLGGLLAGALLLLPLVRRRVKLEDDLLRRRHGEAFSCYGREVPAFLPR